MRGITLLHTHPITFAGTRPVEWSCSSDSQVRDEGEEARNHSVKQELFDISALGCGPRGETVLRGSPSSLVCGGGGWG